MNKFTYPNPRPSLVIERTGGASLGACYDESYWRITSTNRIKKETIRQLFELGLIGFGQEFSIKSQCDGKEPPAGTDTVECVETDQRGNTLPGPAINPYSGEPYKPYQYPYFVYECVSRCDSGD